MKKDNQLSVWSFPYRKQYYLTHPWKWFNDAYWNIRNFWHRGKYGFAYVDVWDFCTWYPRVGAAALRYLAKHGNGYPGFEPWDTPEKWESHLHQMAEDLEKCALTNDICYSDKDNEYAEAFHNMNTNRQRRENPDGSITTWTELTDEQKDLRDKYFARMQEIDKEYDEFNKNTYTTIGTMIRRYWD